MNPRTHHESKNSLGIQKTIVNLEINREFVKSIMNHEIHHGSMLFEQKPAKAATDRSCNGHQKQQLAQKPFRLLFLATISLEPF